MIESKKAASRLGFSLLAILLIAIAAEVTLAPPKPYAQEKGQDAASVMKRSQLSFYYQGDDFQAKVTMELIDREGKKRKRELSMLRKDVKEGGSQKYFVYFTEPPDVKGMTFMVWKYPDKEDDRWIYVPAVDLLKRVAAQDKRSSFVGSDFTYEDISGRDVKDDDHSLIGEETISGKSVFKIESKPKEKLDYVKRISWIDKENFLPLKEEYYDLQNQVYRVFTADRVETKKGKGGKSYPTVMKRTMKNVKSGHRTEVIFLSVSYDTGLKESDFSERNMRHPPREWIK